MERRSIPPASDGGFVRLMSLRHDDYPTRQSVGNVDATH